MDAMLCVAIVINAQSLSASCHFIDKNSFPSEFEVKLTSTSPSQLSCDKLYALGDTNKSNNRLIKAEMPHAIYTMLAELHSTGSPTFTDLKSFIETVSG
jgi:hypothetical protein